MASNARSQLIQHLRGQHVRIPDMKGLFTDWPGTYDDNEGINPHLAAVRLEVEWRLNSIYMSNPSKLCSLKAADFSLFAALWWPKADLRWLAMLAFFSLWIFNCDDEIDEPSGVHADNVQSASHYRDLTTRFIFCCLEVDKDPLVVQPDTIALESFRVIGNAFREASTPSQRLRFYEEWHNYVQSAKVEQEFCLTGRVPSTRQYWKFRAGTSAVRVTLALGEYAGHMSLPDAIMNSAPMQSVWKETNNIISVTNDLLSMKKEVSKGCIDNLIVLLCHEGGTMQNAIHQAFQMIRTSKAKFETAANTLMKDYGSNVGEKMQMRRFLETCQSMCVGNVLWSEQTARYGMGEVAHDNGSQSFVLG